MSSTKLEPLETLKLFEYQKTGAQWLSQKNFALLADKQRLGKTVQSIYASDLIRASRILVVCRAVGRAQWAREYDRWSTIPRHIKVATGTKAIQNPPPSSVTIVSYESSSAIQRGLLGKFDLIIADEAHYLKNPDSGRCRTLMSNSGLIHQTHKMWFLTGTPTPNNAGELWCLLYTVGITKLTFDQFVDKFCDVFESGYGRQITGTKVDSESLSELRGLLSPFMLRRTEEDVKIQLPELFRQTEVVEAGKVNLSECGLFQKELAFLSEDALKEVISRELGVYNSIVNGTASHQLMETLKMQAKSISTLRKFTAMQKVMPLADIINEELESKTYKKVVIFGIHIGSLESLAHKLRAYYPVLCTGSTENKDELIAEFMDPNSKCQVFIGNIQSAGTSISLSIANHIYFLEESWTPGDNAQAEMRCGGINQKNNIFVTKIHLVNSVDMKVSEALNRKTSETNQIYQKQDFGELL